MVLGVQLLSSRWLSCDGEERLVRRLGAVAARLHVRERRAIRNRLAETLDEDTPGRLETLAREALQNRWTDREVFWLRRLAASPARRAALCGRVRIEGLEHLHRALSRQHGAILWETSFGRRLLGKVTLLERGFRLCQLHGPTHGGASTWVGQRVVRRIHRRASARLGLETIEIDRRSFAYLRILVARLRDNRVVCLPALGVFGRRFVPVSFLGATRGFATGAVSLAEMTGAPLIPVFCFRENGGTRLVLEAPVDIAPGPDGAEPAIRAAQHYVGLLGAYVRRFPDQWHWWHDLSLFAPVGPAGSPPPSGAA
jgi:KDO2-lipid IV(A) lauroyltransferase